MSLTMPLAIAPVIWNVNLENLCLNRLKTTFMSAILCTSVYNRRILSLTSPYYTIEVIVLNCIRYPSKTSKSEVILKLDTYRETAGICIPSKYLIRSEGILY